MITEERMISVLGLLLTETSDHDNSAFRGSIDLRFWSKEQCPDEALTSSKQNIAELHENLRKKIELAEEA